MVYITILRITITAILVKNYNNFALELMFKNEYLVVLKIYISIIRNAVKLAKSRISMICF